MAFKDPRTPEEQEQGERRYMLKKLQEQAGLRHSRIESMARDFYSQWVREDEKLTKDEAKRYLERAWIAAEVFYDGVKERQDPILEGDED